MMNQKPLFPRIRFREFENSWQLDNLNSLAQKVWIGLVTTMTTNYVDEGGVPLIRNSDITGGGILESRLIRLSETFASKHSGRAFIQNDIATVHTGDVGTSDVIPETLDGAIGFATLNTRWHEKEFDPYFIKYFFNTRKFRNLAIRYSTGDGRQNLNLKDFVKFHVPRTSLPEQQKISTFLCAVDKKIQLLQRKKELLEQYKKGVMQKIFSQEIRFKDENGNDYPDWEEARLGKIFPFIRNGFVGTATPYYRQSGVKYLQGKNIKNSTIDPTGLVYIKESFHEKNEKSQLAVNDIVMVQSGHVGECAIITEEYDGSNCHALLVLSPSDTICSLFFIYYFHSHLGQRFIYRIKTGNTVAHILSSSLKPEPVIFPTKLEQQNIAEVLLAIDELIRLVEKKVEATKVFKRGLLQQMFV